MHNKEIVPEPKDISDFSIEKNQSELERYNNHFKTLKTSLKLPKIIFNVIETVVFITNRERDELFNDFIVNELESYSYDLDELILFILKRSGLLERLRVGINQYYGTEKIQKKSNEKENKGINYDSEIIDISLKLPKKLMNFINTFWEISNVKKENLFSLLIIARFEYIYSEPEILLDYIDKKNGFFEDLREGINSYYGNEVIQKKKKSKVDKKCKNMSRIKK